jgi:hypothetical protein
MGSLKACLSKLPRMKLIIALALVAASASTNTTVCDTGGLGSGFPKDNTRSGMIVGPYLQNGHTYFDAVIGTTLTLPSRTRGYYLIKSITAIVPEYTENMIARLWGPSKRFADAASSGALSWNISANGADTPLLAASSEGVLGEDDVSGSGKMMLFTFPSAVTVEAGLTVFVTFEIADAKAAFDAAKAAGRNKVVSSSVQMTAANQEALDTATQLGAGVTFLINVATGAVVRATNPQVVQHMVGFECATDVDGCAGAPCSAAGDTGAACTDRAYPVQGADCKCSSSSFVGPSCRGVCGVGSLGTALSYATSGLIVGPYLQSNVKYVDIVVGTTLTLPPRARGLYLIKNVTAVVPHYAKNMIARLWGPSKRFADAAASGALSWNISARDADTPLLSTSSTSVFGEQLRQDIEHVKKMIFTFPSAVTVEAGSTVFVTFEIADAKARFYAERAKASNKVVSSTVYSVVLSGTQAQKDQALSAAKQHGAGVTFQIDSAAGVVLRQSALVQHMVGFECASALPAPSSSPPTRAKKRVVVRTVLKGFSAVSFTVGLQFAFRQAWARFCNVAVTRVSIINVRDVSLRRRLSGGVSFDVQVSTATAQQATDVARQIKSQATDAAVMASFITEIDALRTAGTYEDVPPSFSVPAEATLSVSEPVVEDEEPVEGRDSASPLPIVAGALGGALAVAVAVIAAVRRRKTLQRSKKAAVEDKAATPNSEPTLADVYGSTEEQNVI